MEHGALIAHNTPVPSSTSNLDWIESLKSLLGHSLLVDRVMSRIDPDGWRSIRVRIQNDPVEVSCWLLGRLKQETDTLHIRAILVSEGPSQDIMSADAPQSGLGRVQECANRIGYQIVDTLAAFRADYRADPRHFTQYYAATDKGLGHFSELGNRRIAELVAAALAGEPPVPERP